MGMPCVSANDMYGTRKTDAWLIKRLNKLFDLDNAKKLPQNRWEGCLADMLEQVVVAGDATAGFPYCKDKSFAWDELTAPGSILDILVEAMKSGDWGVKRRSLIKEHPEWFLCELKNKLDRYEVSKLDTKCRPYLALPFHFSVLQSNLCQVFCNALPTVGSSKTSHNAYGFSSVDGGLDRIRARMCALKKEKLDYYCYGDDTDLYYRDREGRLWRCSPDFSQMDGSVDAKTVELTCKWVYNRFVASMPNDVGHVQFWHNVCEEWASMAVNPMFVCDGPTVYQKARAQGVMPGGGGR